MKKTLLTILSILLATGAVYCADVVIEAKKQTLNVDSNKGYFDGDVKVTIGDVVVKSPRAELDLEPSSKKPSLATFFDNPYAFSEKENKKHEIKANIIKVSLIKKNILAQGNSQSIMMEDRKPVITINAESQEYNTVSKVMTAKGGVIIFHKDLETFSDMATAVINKKGEIEDMKLIGHVVMKEKSNVIKGDKFEYSPKREEYQVSGNTTSDVVFDDGSRVYVEAKYQQFNKNTKAMIAGGNVKIIYKDYTATGPKAQLIVDKATGKPNEIIFSGRSKIKQEGSVVEADIIKLTLKPKSFYADGNVKTSISGEGGVGL